MYWPYIGCGLFIAAAFITDVRTMKIPNWISLPSFISGLLCHAVFGGWSGLLFGLKGAALGAGIFFIMYCFGAVGGGDVKLFGGIGAWTGMEYTFSTLVYSILIAGFIGIIILVFRKETFRRIRGLFQAVFGSIIIRSMKPVEAAGKEMLRFPFMLAVLPGYILAYVYL